jgi:hypothetical protein
MKVMGYSLFLDAIEARPSVTSISVHLHIENTIDEFIGGVFRAKSDHGHQLAVRRHTLVAPVKGSYLLQMVGVHTTECR